MCRWCVLLLFMFSPVMGACPGDFNSDGLIDADDFAFLVTEWTFDASMPGFDGSHDLNADEQIDVVDMAILLSEWGNAICGPQIDACPQFPADNAWNTRVDGLPVHPQSDAWIQSIGNGGTLHPDFGSGLWNGGPIGIPYVVVNGDQELVDISFTYDDESDPGPYPIPPDAPIEGGPNSSGDRHVLVVDRDNCMLYEVFAAYPQLDGSWEAGSGAVYDLMSNDLRPDGWTSADAAGLPILPGLVRYEEVVAGRIDHALRFTASQTQRAYLWPARHYASSITNPNVPPMGARLRLKAEVDISGYHPYVQVILTALKEYGMILADNGSNWFISGVPDEGWDNDILATIDGISGNQFEAVDSNLMMVHTDSGQAILP